MLLATDDDKFCSERCEQEQRAYDSGYEWNGKVFQEEPVDAREIEGDRDTFLEDVIADPSLFGDRDECSDDE